MKRGFTLIEILIYIALLVLMLLLIINTTLSFTGSYRPVAALRTADRAAVSSMERLTREIRLATAATVDTSSTTANTLTLTAGSTITEFYVDNGVLKVDINGTFSGPLTPSGAWVTDLDFAVIDNGNSKAVKVDMVVNGVSGQTTITKKFHTTVVMKGI